MSQLGTGSGNKLQRQRKDPCSLEKRARQGKHTQRKRVGKGTGMLHRESLPGSSILRAFKGGDFRRGPRGRISVDYLVVFQVVLSVL